MTFNLHRLAAPGRTLSSLVWRLRQEHLFGLLQFAEADQVVRNLLGAGQRIRHRMQATGHTGLRFRAGDVVEPILTNGDGRVVVCAAKYQVHVQVWPEG